MRDDIYEYIKTLEGLNFNFSDITPIYNPMEEFVQYVITKEIVHSKILTDLLKEDGLHGLGPIFIDSFLSKFLDIKRESIKDIQVIRERHVSRQITSGQDRSIDIFIEYSNLNREKCAIIIENKLNNAEYQPLQLEDYYLSIESEGYQNISVISLHKFYDPSDANKIILDDVDVLVLYPLDLARWLSDCIKGYDSHVALTIYSYITYLKNLHIYNIMLSNIKVLSELDSETLIKVKEISEAFNKLMNDRKILIMDALAQKWPNLNYRYHPYTSHIEIWDSEMWDKNGCEIVVWVEKDYNSLWIVTANNDTANLTLINRSGFQRDQNSNDWGYQWYENSDINRRCFGYPEKSSFVNMINEIDRLLAILHLHNK